MTREQQIHDICFNLERLWNFHPDFSLDKLLYWYDIFDPQSDLYQDDRRTATNIQAGIYSSLLHFMGEEAD